MFEHNLLSILLAVPVLGSVAIYFLKDDKAIKQVALGFTLIELVLSLLLWQRFDGASSAFQFVERYDWFWGIQYYLGVDGISILFIVLTAVLMPVCVLASWNAIEKRVKEYMIAFLVLETLMIGVFGALDLMVFYIFFEGGLIPMYLIIGVWGGKRRIYASYKFFLYTLLGSVFMLLAMFYMWQTAGTTSIPELMTATFGAQTQIILWTCFFASFAVKMPMWPVHTWLPDAHVEAPTAGSVILAGVLLKMGGYGFLRFSLPMFPWASEYLAPLVFGMSLIAIVYTSLVALVQEDMKKLIAYSSVAHMGFVTIGIFAFNQQGLDGAMYVMLAHGVVSAALFLCVGVIYDRLHTREINRYGGLVHNMPKYAVVFMIFMLASVGLPGLANFVGEFLVLVGIYHVSTWVTFVATTGVILGAAYMLWLYRRVVFGVLEKDDVKAMPDMDKRELGYMVPLALIVIVMGVKPDLFLATVQASTANLSAQVSAGIEKTEKLEAQRIADEAAKAAAEKAEREAAPVAAEAAADNAASNEATAKEATTNDAANAAENAAAGE